MYRNKLLQQTEGSARTNARSLGTFGSVSRTLVEIKTVGRRHVVDGVQGAQDSHPQQGNYPAQNVSSNKVEKP